MMIISGWVSDISSNRESSSSFFVRCVLTLTMCCYDTKRVDIESEFVVRVIRQVYLPPEVRAN